MSQSFLEIDKRGSQLGLDLINSDGDSFFLYEMPLLSLWENTGSYVLVKRRNRDDKQAIAYHAGQVLGALVKSVDMVRLELHFGPVGQDIDYDSDRKVLERVVSRQVYVLPLEDLKAVVAAFRVNRRNRIQFDEMKTVGRPLALFEM